jgi:DNA-binding response OmpR family regulator
MKHSILIVDDDVDTCASVSDILGDLGYRTDIAHNGPDALKLIQRSHYDVALLDLKMPGMDGLTLYREIKKLRSETVAFLVTAFAGGDTVDAARRAGVSDILPKPVNLPKLLGLIDDAVGHPLLLIVDDDPDFCESMWDILHERHYRVCLAHNLQQARERLQQLAYDIVIMDLKLPDGSGHEIFSLTKEIHPQAQTVVITGCRSEMDSVIQQILQEGGDVVLDKPLNLDEMLSRLKRLA